MFTGVELAVIVAVVQSTRFLPVEFRELIFLFFISKNPVFRVL